MEYWSVGVLEFKTPASHFPTLSSFHSSIIPIPKHRSLHRRPSCINKHADAPPRRVLPQIFHEHELDCCNPNLGEQEKDDATRRQPPPKSTAPTLGWINDPDYLECAVLSSKAERRHAVAPHRDLPQSQPHGMSATFHATRRRSQPTQDLLDTMTASSRRDGERVTSANLCCAACTTA